MNRVRVWLLKQKLKRCGDFFMGGYQHRMVEVNGKYLKPWAVEQIHDWWVRGLIDVSVEKSVISTSTGITYTSRYYKFKSYKK